MIDTMTPEGKELVAQAEFRATLLSAQTKASVLAQSQDKKRRKKYEGAYMAIGEILESLTGNISWR